jgi:hypothetical protein
MANRLLGAGLGLQIGLRLALAVAALATPSPAVAQESLVSAPAPSRAIRPRILANKLPDKPSLPPAFKVAVGPLGFSAPGSLYLGQRISLVSLDFLDEDRLLFTFRVPGLIRREAAEREAGEDEERRIRALVLKLPEGSVEAQALWTVHDRARYLWMLKDGSFLFRDLRSLETGDASLELKPYLRFPGPLLWLETDPTEKFLVTNSREPAAAQKPAEAPGAASNPSEQEPSIRPGGKTLLPGDLGSLGLGTLETVDAPRAAQQQNPPAQPDLAVRILRRASGEVILVSRNRTAVHLPINSEGYLENLRAKANGWLLSLNYFSGGSTILGQIDSACSPISDFLSQREVLMTGCTDTGAADLVAMETGGRRLWEVESSQMTVWPLIVRAPDGSRLARESLVVSTPVSARTPIDPEEIRGQLVEVLDAADGNTVLETAASPALDAGGNVAISPSGRRVAVLNGGQIQVFELPPAPPLPGSATYPSVH